MIQQPDVDQRECFGEATGKRQIGLRRFRRTARVVMRHNQRRRMVHQRMAHHFADVNGIFRHGAARKFDLAD